MTVARIKDYPYPERIESIEDVKEYLKELYRTLQEESVERIEDFEGLNIDTATITNLTSTSIDIGTGAIETTSKARIYLGTNQLNIADTTETLVEVDTVTDDPGSIFNAAGHKIIIPVTGWYSIVGQITYYNTTAPANYRATIFNGATAMAKNYQPQEVARTTSPRAVIETLLTVDDEITLSAYHNAGVNTPDIRATDEETFLSVHLLSI